MIDTMHQPKPNRFRPIEFPAHGDVTGEHPCPSCGASVVRRYVPGRSRIYCTNACRQRAYRWRRAHGIRLCVERTGPAERASSLLRRHALRDRRDPASRLTDTRRREVSVCGAFVRPARLATFTHYDFLPSHPWSCTSCQHLIGAPDD